jgi:hypothetical protein
MGLPLAKIWAGLNWFEVETAWATPERLVVTPLRDDGNPSRQQSLERPEGTGQVAVGIVLVGRDQCAITIGPSDYRTQLIEEERRMEGHL